MDDDYSLSANLSYLTTGFYGVIVSVMLSLSISGEESSWRPVDAFVVGAFYSLPNELNSLRSCLVSGESCSYVLAKHVSKKLRND